MVGQVAHASLKDQLRALRFFADHVGPETLLEQITPRDAESFVAARLASGVKPSTVNKDIRTLRGIFNLAIEPRCYLAEGTNPFRKIRERKIAAQPPRYVTPEDFQKVVNSENSLWWRAFLAQVTQLWDSFRNFRDGILISGAAVGFLRSKADVVKTRPLASR